MRFRNISAPVAALFALIVIVAVGVINGYFAGAEGRPRLFAWLSAVAAILILCVCIGIAIRKSWTGVIESARNRISLSRLQMLLWTVLVLSAFVTAAVGNFWLDPEMSALKITIPPQLLAAMGIAATSLVVAPAVLSLKPVASVSSAPGTVAGSIHTRADSAGATWLDIFRGDEEGNCDTPDLSKIQQFLITLALVGLYGCLVGQRMLMAGAIHTLPPLDENFVWLLGISHAGYLAYKAVPHPSAQAATAASAAGAPADPSDDDAVG